VDGFTSALCCSDSRRQARRPKAVLSRQTDFPQIQTNPPMKPSRWYHITASSWRRLALAPAVLLAVGFIHAKNVEPLTYLTFDEGTGTYAADSTGDNPATLLGGAGWTAGLVGPFALSLPGTSGSFADISSTVVNTTQSFSVAAWVKLNNTDGYQTFVSEDTPGGESAFFLQLRGDSHQFSFTVPYDFFVNPQSLFTRSPISGITSQASTTPTPTPQRSM
jgi:hypothetical protein